MKVKNFVILRLARKQNKLKKEVQAIQRIGQRSRETATKAGNCWWLSY